MDIEKHNDPLFNEIKSKADNLEIKPKADLFNRVSDLLDADQKKPVRRISPLYNFVGIAASIAVLFGCFWFINNNINNTGNRQYASAAVFENLEDGPMTSLSESIYNSTNIVKSINAYYEADPVTRLSSVDQSLNYNSNGYTDFSSSSAPASGDIKMKSSKYKMSIMDSNLSTVSALLGNWKFTDVTPANGANFPEEQALQNVQNLDISQKGNQFYLNVSSLNKPNNISLELDQSLIGGKTFLFRTHTDSNQLLINVKSKDELNIGLMPNVNNGTLERMGFEQNKSNDAKRTYQ